MMALSTTEENMTPISKERQALLATGISIASIVGGSITGNQIIFHMAVLAAPMPILAVFGSTFITGKWLKAYYALLCGHVINAISLAILFA
jgi:hypothetical protein